VRPRDIAHQIGVWHRTAAEHALDELPDIEPELISRPAIARGVMRGWARVGNVHGPHGFVDLDSFMGLGRSRCRGGSSERERRSDDCRGDQSFHGTLLILG
jgi:hypothetical protein